ncbi:MAG TPA: hypothetical protein VII69_04680 [Candidatus Eremiobacteraceae bacterium]
MKAFWRWTGTIFFALVFVFLVMTGIGTSLPIDHHAVCSANYARPVHFLFAVVENDDTSVYWRPEISRAELVSGRGATAVWRETDTHGSAIIYRTIAYAEDNKLVRTIDFVPGMPFGGTWAYIFSAESGRLAIAPINGSGLTIIEDGKIYNPFFRFMARYVFGYTQTMKTYLTDLARLTHDKPAITCAANP